MSIFTNMNSIIYSPYVSTTPLIRDKVELSMNCIGCEESEVFNRVIVNQINHQELGLYCEQCETEKFGSLLNDSSWHQDRGCAFCENAGTYQLPKVDCLIKDDDGEPKHIDFEMYDDTVALCEDHLKELIPEKKIFKELMDKEKVYQEKLEV